MNISDQDQVHSLPTGFIEYLLCALPIGKQPPNKSTYSTWPLHPSLQGEIWTFMSMLESHFTDMSILESHFRNMSMLESHFTGFSILESHLTDMSMLESYFTCLYL